MTHSRERVPGDRDLLSHYMARARADNTKRTYAGQWRRFAAWCAQREVSALPASPQCVAQYLAERAQSGTTVGSINVALAAICFMHRRSGLSFARRHATLGLVLEGIRRAHAREQHQAQPLTGKLLAEVLATLGDAPRDLRDATLLSLLYAFALRASEVVALDWLERGTGRGWIAATADVVSIGLLGTKAAPCRPHVIAIPAAANPGVMAALQRWTEFARLAPGEPVLRPLARGGRIRPSRLGTASVSGIVKRSIARYLHRVGHDVREAAQLARRFSGHSGRVGLYVSASEAGVPAQHIAALARHTSLTMALRYTRQAELLRCAPHARPGVGV